MLLSVIIPIYKAEPYIERCARSLMEQTMKDGIEFIFVNDCSPDSSVDILTKVLLDYPQRKDYVHIINNKVNIGVTGTRMIGLEAAMGDYIGWCDSDDWIERNMYEKMYDATNHGSIDIIVCNTVFEHSTSSELITYKVSRTPQESIQNLWKGFYFPGSLCVHITKKTILKDSLQLITPVQYGEDIYSLIIAYYKANSISFISDYMYHYDRTNTSSLIHNTVYTYDHWLAQKSNLELITKVLYHNKGKELYHVTCNALKNSIKWHFKSSFSSIRLFYYELSECYKDVNVYYFTPQKPVINRIKTYLVYNVFALFWLYHHKEF